MTFFFAHILYLPVSLLCYLTLGNTGLNISLSYISFE